MDSTPNPANPMHLLFSDYLKNKSLRNTTERKAILGAVCQTKDFFTHDLIWKYLKDSNFQVSRASIYNTMELLLDANIVTRLQFAGIHTLYLLKHIAEQHNYAICTQCHTVHKIKNDRLNRVFADYKIPKFTMAHYSLQVYGICSKCKFRIRKQVAGSF